MSAAVPEPRLKAADGAEYEMISLAVWWQAHQAAKAKEKP